LTVATDTGLVRISGAIEMNEPCYDFSGRALTRGDSLVVTLLAVRRSGPCLQFLADFGYTMTVSGVAPGVYLIVLSADRRGPPTFVATLLVKTVAVP
jgi:hypothetical protein